MHRSALVALLAVACLTLTGCGDGLDPSAAEATGDRADRVQVAGTDQLLWRPPVLTASPGAIDVRVDCDHGAGHQLAIEGINGGEPIAACRASGTGSGAVELEAGNYTFFCAVPGHREEGMEGDLVVE